MKDNDLGISVTSGESASRKGDVVTIPYTISGSGAKTETKAYVMVTDKGYTESSANVLQYTALTAGTVSGTGTFTLASSITGTWGTDYHVYLMAVNEGGEKKTDYASTPVELHLHNFSYTVGTGDQANTITAACENAGCDITTGLTMTISAPTDLTYDGQPKAAALNADYNKTAFPDSYTICYQGTGDTAYNSTTAPTNAGDYKATVTVGTAVAEVSFTLSQAELTITANDQTYEYNGQIQGPGDMVYEDPAEIAKMVTAVGLQGNDAITSVIVDGQGKDVGTYELVPYNATVNEASASENYDVKYINGTLKIQLPISYTVTFKVVNGSWNDGTSTDKTVTLTGYEGDMLKLTSDQIPAVGSKPNDTFKAGSWDVTPSTETAITGATTYTYTYSQKDTAVVKTAPTAKTLTYTGSAQELITAGAASGGTMQYALGTVTEATQSYTASIPTGIAAGTYYVWYKVIGDENHTDSKAECVAVTIKPAEAAVYAVISATDTDHTVGDGRDAVVTVKRGTEDSRTFSLYTGSAMDETALPAGSHNAAEGSLILTLKASYLDTLSPGNHKLTVSFRDGSAEAVVNIKAAEPVETPKTPETPEVPKTGDAAEPVLWIALAALGLAVIIRVWMKSRKKS